MTIQNEKKPFIIEKNIIIEVKLYINVDKDIKQLLKLFYQIIKKSCIIIIK